MLNRKYWKCEALVSIRYTWVNLKFAMLLMHMKLFTPPLSLSFMWPAFQIINLGMSAIQVLNQIVLYHANIMVIQGHVVYTCNHCPVHNLIQHKSLIATTPFSSERIASGHETSQHHVVDMITWHYHVAWYHVTPPASHDMWHHLHHMTSCDM